MNGYELKLSPSLMKNSCDTKSSGSSDVPRPAISPSLLAAGAKPVTAATAATGVPPVPTPSSAVRISTGQHRRKPIVK